MICHTTPRPAPAPSSHLDWLAEQHAVTTHELSRRLNVPLAELVERLDRAGPDTTVGLAPDPTPATIKAGLSGVGWRSPALLAGRVGGSG